MTYSKFCKCGGSILTVEQMATDQLCTRCREEKERAVIHAHSLKHRLDLLNKEETNDNEDNNMD